MAPEFDVARTDPLVRMVRGWLGLGSWGVVAGGLVFMGGAHWLLAWSEETLWPRGYVVDRSFLDYFSFPYSFAVLIPAFLGGGLLFYSSVQKWLPGVLQVSLRGNKPVSGDNGLPSKVLELWGRHAAFCNSRLLMSICLVVAVAAGLAQKIQWARDPGTAFVDLRYAGHVSLTAAYHTIASVVTIYAAFGCVLRGGAGLSFVSRVYARKWRERTGVQTQFDYTHPDGCSGMQPLGWILLEYYVLLLLLAAQILLNLVEKLRFYESMQIVLQHTLVSVGAFAFASSVTAPYLVGRPLLTVHTATRQFRRHEAIRVSAVTDAHRETLLLRAQKGEADSADTRVFEALLTAEEVVHAMPLWPMDLKATLYFIASRVVPLLSLLPSFLDRSPR